MTIDYLEGFCKTAEECGVQPSSLLDYGLEKKAFTLVELLTVMGMLGAGAYGGKKVYDAVKKPTPAPVAPGVSK